MNFKVEDSKYFLFFYNYYLYGVYMLVVIGKEKSI